MLTVRDWELVLGVVQAQNEKRMSVPSIAPHLEQEKIDATVRGMWSEQPLALEIRNEISGDPT